MKITAEPRSDQWNADDFIGGPRTFTIAGVKAGAAEQKYDIQLVEGEGRVWRPPPTVLRELIQCWGTDDGKEWVGRRVTLYRDGSVRFGPDAVGGIRVSHASHLPGGKPFEGRVTKSRGKKTPFRIDPLPDPSAADRVAALRAEWTKADADRRKAIEVEVASLSQTADTSTQTVEPGSDGDNWAKGGE